MVNGRLTTRPAARVLHSKYSTNSSINTPMDLMTPNDKKDTPVLTKRITHRHGPTAGAPIEVSSALPEVCWVFLFLPLADHLVQLNDLYLRWTSLSTLICTGWSLLCLLSSNSEFSQNSCFHDIEQPLVSVHGN